MAAKMFFSRRECFRGVEAAAAALSLHGCLECTTQPDQVSDQHLGPSLTCRTRKFPQVFTTWRERKQVILHQMNLNEWMRIQGFAKKKNK